MTDFIVGSILAPFYDKLRIVRRDEQNEDNFFDFLQSDENQDSQDLPWLYRW